MVLKLGNGSVPKLFAAFPLALQPRFNSWQREQRTTVLSRQRHRFGVA